MSVIRSLFGMVLGDQSWTDLHAMLEESDNNDKKRVTMLRDQYGDAPYTFCVEVRCTHGDPYLLEFNPNNPFDDCKHICQHCKGEISLISYDVHPEYELKDVCLVPVRNRRWYDDRLFGDVSRHDIKAHTACEKLFKKVSDTGSNKNIDVI